MPTPTTNVAVKPLEVIFTDLHYECRKKCIGSDVSDAAWWGYRSLQVLMVVTNRSSSLTLKGGYRHWEGWAPTRWIVTNGSATRTMTHSWQWGLSVDGSRQQPYRRPDLGPGERGEWTWMAFPLAHDEWVAAVEYVDEWGNLYRQDLGRPEPGQFNYVDCGEPLEGDC